MVARRPVVIGVDGVKREMPIGDTIPLDMLPAGVGISTAAFAVRSDETLTTVSIPPYSNTTDYYASMGYAWRVYQVSSPNYCRLRLYSTLSSRSLDVFRPVGIDPDLQSGLLLDFVLLPDRIYTLSPMSDGANLETVPSFDTPATITNLSNLYANISISLKFIRTE